MPNQPGVPLPPPQLADWIREVAAGQDPRVGSTTPVVPLLTRGLPTRPIAPEHSQVFICAGVIVKLHHTQTNRQRLTRRLHCIGGPDMDRLWIQPLIYRPFDAPGGRLATIWPRVSVLATIDRPPWAAVGELLARLHRLPVVDDPPRLGGHSRLARTISYLKTYQTDLDWLITLGEQLTEQLAEPRRITQAHGDFHLGQLGHTPLRRSWKLLDVDDFGVGDPAWDLSRPAGFWAVGLLSDEDWTELLDSYRAAGGPAVPANGDPWPDLEPTARAAVLIAAVQQMKSMHRDDTTQALLNACRRMHT